MRASWAWDSLPWYGDDGHHRWPLVAHYPQVVGWDKPGDKEHMPVAIGQHPLSFIGRSFHNGQQPATDDYDVTPLTDKGPYFEEQWKHALEVDPQFVFVTGWNEWMAGGQVCRTTDQEALNAIWNFYPGAHLTRAGHPLKLGDVYFIDQYNQELSRDAEQMRGGHTDNYYYQLVANIRRFKGVRQLPKASAAKTIDIKGCFSQWEDIQPEFRDHLYETLPRNEPGWGSAGNYVNNSGRNEFVRLKVEHDAQNVYFYAQSRQAVTPYTDPNWMLLFINRDQSKDTGWDGYNYLVNYPVIDSQHTSVKANAGGWRWKMIGESTYRVEGNQLMLSVPRALIGQVDQPLSFDFHWADNIEGSGKTEDFFLNGDTAPNRRFDYHYQE